MRKGSRMKTTSILSIKNQLKNQNIFNKNKWHDFILKMVLRTLFILTFPVFTLWVAYDVYDLEYGLWFSLLFLSITFWLLHFIFLTQWNIHRERFYLYNLGKQTTGKVLSVKNFSGTELFCNGKLIEYTIYVNDKEYTGYAKEADIVLADGWFEVGKPVSVLYSNDDPVNNLIPFRRYQKLYTIKN